MKKNSTEFTNFKRFMAKMEHEKKVREMLYKAKKKKGAKDNGKNNKQTPEDN